MIRFFTEEIAFTLAQKKLLRQWLSQQTKQAGYTLGELNYIFCSDEYVLQVNRDFLQHDYYTDIITFDQREEESKIEGDVFISVDRVTDNAHQLSIPFEHELHRVMAHGLLHLCGYGDKTNEEKTQMRAKEEEWLAALALPS